MCVPFVVYLYLLFSIQIKGDMMIANQIMFYNTTIDEAQEMLEMESRRDNAMINFEEFQVKLNKRGPNVLVSLIKSTDEMSIQDGLVQ